MGWVWRDDEDDQLHTSSPNNSEFGSSNPRSGERCSTRKVVKSQCRTEEVESGKFVRKCEKTQEILRECIGNALMEDVGSSQGSKHVWTVEKDNLLVQCLVQMKTDGKYTVDNGFRPGYLTYIEGYINERVPRCGIKGIPHIQSRLKTLKTTWKVVYDMIHRPNTSGFDWNPDTNTVTAPNAVWDEYLKSHKKAAPFRFKAFPHFKNLCIVWAKDRASGRDAETIADILNTDASPYAAEEADVIEEININQDDDQNGVFSEQPSTPGTEVTSSSRKRRRNEGDVIMDSMCNSLDLIDKGFRESAKEIGAHLSRIAHKANLAEKREKLWEELTKVPGFTKQEMAKAAKMISQDESMLTMFSTLPLDVKEIYIRDYIS